MGVEEVRNESKVKTGVTSYESRRSEIFPAAYTFGVVQDLAMVSEQLRNEFTFKHIPGLPAE